MSPLSPPGTAGPGTGARSGRMYWRDVLTAGGSTTIPRWARHPVAGIARYEAEIPADVATSLRRRAGELAVPVSSVLLAAHAKVLSALSGEPEVTAGYAASADGPPLPCRLAAWPGPWRAVVAAAGRAETELLSHRDFPVASLRRELGVEGPSFETVFGPAGCGSGHGDLPKGTVLAAGIQPDGDRLRLRLRYRADALDAAAAARIAGYHVTALALIAADPDADHSRQSLLSAAELRCQLEELAGPRRERPDRRVHELFEQRVRVQPDAVAACRGGQRWTYRQLNDRANRLAHALLARGVRREEPVAVVTERNLDWMAAVLAVFKAGGVYLPIEPHFPAGRIEATLRRAGCRLVLTEPGSTGTLSQALTGLPGVKTLFTGTAYAEAHPGSDPGVPVAAGQLAYIYFTSGSTGEPKGAMCEHAGMVNHLFAKITDLEIGEGQVVAQTAPQCFDISLWQLVSALLAGGQTLLIEQETILDAERFVDTLARGRVAVLQVVPSYLEAILSYLEQHPRDLPALRYVSVTGEALKRELAHRWFAAMPGVRLLNAYGLTETSDDTNHEIMDRAPDGERVPLGRPIPNVNAYVVDEHLSPVPLGAPGAIVFSGVCVGRGYVNDPERTRQAFLADPHRPGQRLYLAGDYGRWRPDGKLEFLGRRDSQVKISGFRIEIGEIENRLLRVPGVRDAAVVVTQRADQSKALVAFCTGHRPLDPGLLRDRLGQSLPAYMVPSAFHWRDSLPLTANSKIDRKALTQLATALAAEPGRAEDSRQAPATPAEQRLAAAWAKVLGLPQDQIGARDDFFGRGGTSLSAVKLAVTLDRVISLKDITGNPVLADMARLLDAGPEPGSGLLQLLWQPDGERTGALVCFPCAGGNAADFRAMADAMSGSGLAVYAVELPGHEAAARIEPFAPLAQVAEQVATEITGRGLARVLLWGQSSGAAFAVAAAGKLEERGAAADRVFLGAQLPGDAVADALDTAPGEKLSAPVTVVVAADDPLTADFPHRYRDWLLLASSVDLHELADGGHDFPRTRPAETAQAVLHAAGLLSSSH